LRIPRLKATGYRGAACGSGSTSEHHLETARGYLADNKLNAAVIELKNALQKDPNQPEGRWLLGNAYMQYGRGAAAEREFTVAGDLGYPQEKLTPAILRAYLIQHKYKELIDNTDTLVEDKDIPADILTLRGEAFQGLNQSRQAEISFNQALAKDSSSINARLGLAQIALDSDQNDVARTLISEVELLAPNEVNMLILRGELALKRGFNSEVQR